MSELNYHNNPLDDLLEELQDDPLNQIIMSSHVDEDAANRLFDEYFGSLVVNGVDQSQPIQVNTSSDIIRAEFHPDQADICILQSRSKTPEVNEAATQIPHMPETDNSKNIGGQEFPSDSSPTYKNQSRTGVGTSFEQRVNRGESSRSRRDRKRNDSSRFRRRLRQSLSKLDAALNVKLGYAKRSQIEIIESAARLLEQNQ